MNLDQVISWLLNSDLYLVGGWLVALVAAVILSFTDICAIPRRRVSTAISDPERSSADVEVALSFVRERGQRR